MISISYRAYIFSCTASSRKPDPVPTRYRFFPQVPYPTRCQNFRPVPPLQGIVYLGRLLLIYHLDKMCPASCKLRTNDNLISPSLIKVHPVSETGDAKTAEDKPQDELASHSLAIIADKIIEKNKTAEARYQWCFIVSVTDRIACIATVIICIILGLDLYGLSFS